MKCFKIKQNNNGFTLMEVTAAFAILTVSLLLLATFFLIATRMIARGNEIKDQGNNVFASAESGLYGNDIVAYTIENYSVKVKLKDGAAYQSLGTLKGYKNAENELVDSHIYVPTEVELSDDDIDDNDGINLPFHVGDESISPYIGVYDSTYKYRIGDFFLYKGSYYKVLKSSQTYYEPGDLLAKFLYKKIMFDYDQQSSYEAGDVIRSGKKYYRSLSFNTPGSPNEEDILNSYFWEEVMPGPDNIKWIQVK